jgi:hypothetical protein
MPLLPCPARRVLEGETGVYFCAHPQMHALDQRVSPEVCQICPYPAQPAPAVFRPFPPPPPRGSCTHLGGFKTWRQCPSCGGSVRLKVFVCNHPRHLETTLRECVACADFRDHSTNTEAPAVTTETDRQAPQPEPGESTHDYHL